MLSTLLRELIGTTTGRSLIGRRAREWGLGALLITLAVDVFVVAPLAQGGTSHVVQPVVHSIVLVSGIVIAFRSRGIVRILVGVLVVAGLVTHWTYHDHPTVELGRADTALSLTFTAIITALILLEVFRAGPITTPRTAFAARVPSWSAVTTSASSRARVESNSAGGRY